MESPGPAAASRRGFTLIEILVVIVVIAILASLVAPNVVRHVGTAKDATARAQIEMLGAALDAYRLDNGRYPTSEQGLSALWQQPTSEPGVAIGIIVALGAARVLASLLFAVSAHDPVVLSAAAAVMLIIAALASLVPSLRATRIDPMAALREL